ncbi:MAG TPA: hypothetical protein VN109_01965 [Devosia sp.]|jgi:type VI protein secretion system component VasF|nr:hypothetical protein [Devosia sp.]
MTFMDRSPRPRPRRTGPSWAVEGLFVLAALVIFLGLVSLLWPHH